MTDHGGLDSPSHPPGIAIELVLQVDIGVTSSTTLMSWRRADLLRFPGLHGQMIRLIAGRRVVAEGEVTAAADDRLELRLTRVV